MGRSKGSNLKVKTTEKSRKIAMDSSLTSVAIVNKSPRATRSVTSKTAKVNDISLMANNSNVNKRKAAGKIAFDELATPVKKNKTAMKSKKKTAELVKSTPVDPESQSDLDDNSVTMNFTEGNELIEKEVDANEDDYFQDEYSAGTSDQDLGNESDSTENEVFITPSKLRKDAEKSNKERINDIDREMALKLQQLHKIMAQGGLNESVEVLTNCIKLSEKQSVSRELQGNHNDENSNDNAMPQLQIHQQGW